MPFSETQIQCVMHDTGMDRIQAIHHLQARQLLAELKEPFPLGKSVYLNTDSQFAAWSERHPELANHA
jgi:hypothetical protein